MPFFSLIIHRTPSSTLFPYTTLFRSRRHRLPRRSSNARAFRIGCGPASRSEEHTSELQSRRDLVCRLLLEKKKKWGLLVVWWLFGFMVVCSCLWFCIV